MKKINIEVINETIYYDKADNGLEIYVWPNEKSNNYYATLSVKYGSIDTKFKVDNKVYNVPNGTAHFLEHVNFNESDTTTAHDYFNKLGSSINAFTTFDYTSYEVYGVSNIEDNINHLLDYVETPYFTDKLVSKEKGIIKEEVNMGKNNPSQVLFYEFNNILYNKDNRKYLVTGNTKEVDSITTSDLNNVYNNFYHPSNMFITITGNVEPSHIITLIKENQNNKQFNKYTNPEKLYEEEPNKVALESKEIEGNITIPRLKIAYKIPKKVFEGLEDYQILLYIRLLLNVNFGPTSNIREELLEKELVTGLNAQCSLVNDYIIISINSETKYPKEIIKELDNCLMNMTIDKQQLERKIKVAESDIIYGLDDIDYTNYIIQDYIISYNKILTNNLVEIKKMNLNTCKKIIDIIKDNNSKCHIIMYPKKSN